MEGLTSLRVALRSAPRHQAIQLQVLAVIVDLVLAGAIRFARECHVLLLRVVSPSAGEDSQRCCQGQLLLGSRPALAATGGERFGCAPHEGHLVRREAFHLWAGLVGAGTAPPMAASPDQARGCRARRPRLSCGYAERGDGAGGVPRLGA